MANLQASVWMFRALCEPGQHTAKRQRKCTRQSTFFIVTLPNNYRLTKKNSPTDRAINLFLFGYYVTNLCHGSTDWLYGSLSDGVQYNFIHNVILQFSRCTVIPARPTGGKRKELKMRTQRSSSSGGKVRNGPITIAIRARFEYDSTTTRLRFGYNTLRDAYDSSTIQHPTRSHVLSSNNEHVNSFAML